MVQKEICPGCKEELKAYEYKCCTKCKEKFSDEGFKAAIKEYSTDYESYLANQTTRSQSGAPSNPDSKPKLLPSASVAEKEWWEREYGDY